MEASCNSTSTSASLLSMPQVTARDAVPPPPTTSSNQTPVDTPGQTSLSADTQRLASSDVWSGAIARVQQQVSYNTSLLESHRRQMQDMDQAIGRLHTDFHHAVGVINDFRLELREIRQRPVASEPSFKHDSGDLDVLANQIAMITSKANEIEGLKMQLELMKNRIKRMEEQGPLIAQKLEVSSANGRDQSFVDNHSTLHQRHQRPHQPLPPIRAASISSRDERGPVVLHQATHVPSKGLSPYSSSSDTRHHHNEGRQMQSSHSVYKTSEPALPPPTTLSGWRPAEAPSHHQLQSTAVSSHSEVPPQVPLRSHVMDVDHHTSGWAPVNHLPKRPFEDQRHSPYGSPHMPGSPKRQRLAPIMPRGTGVEESFAKHHPSQPNVTHDDRAQERGRLPSDSSLQLTQALPPPASANMSAYRFIPSSQQVGPQEHWRSEPEHTPVQPPGRSGRGRGRGGRGRGRPRETGGATQHLNHHEEHVALKPEEVKWAGGPVAPNGHYKPAYSPRSPMVHGGHPGSAGFTAGGHIGRDHPPQPPIGEYPATPVHGLQDPFQQDGGSSKKSRTKPIRNAEGILIRKDGRPDMRSVSSANNLRKVHAKKEAERAGTEGRSPTSAALEDSRSPEDDDHACAQSHGTPASMSGSQNELNDEDNRTSHMNSEGRTRDLMLKIFPQGYDASGRQGEKTFAHTLGGSLEDIIMKVETVDGHERRHESPRNVEMAMGVGHTRPAEANMAVIAESAEV